MPVTVQNLFTCITGFLVKFFPVNQQYQKKPAWMIILQQYLPVILKGNS